METGDIITIDGQDYVIMGKKQFNCNCWGWIVHLRKPKGKKFYGAFFTPDFGRHSRVSPY